MVTRPLPVDADTSAPARSMLISPLPVPILRRIDRGTSTVYSTLTRTLREPPAVPARGLVVV